MLIFFYHYIWLIVFSGCLIIACLMKKQRLLARLALTLPEHPVKEKTIWIHALSVGEVISAVPLVEALKKKFQEHTIIFSVTTAKGMEIAQKKLADKVILLTMPIDFIWCIHRLTNYIRPSIFILVETDIWPAISYHLKKKGVKSLLVNGRISLGTYRSYKRLPYITKILFRPLASCLMQSELDRNRLISVLGKRQAKKVYNAGNIKFDRQWKPMEQNERKTWIKTLGLDQENLIWIAGSTHPGEEKIILEVFQKLLVLFPELQLVIAPRKIDRSDEIKDLALKMGIKATKKTDLDNKKIGHGILILNTLGELGRIYGIGDISFVGGSLIPFGGHNLLEPAAFGCPVIFGPHTDNFVSMAGQLEKVRGGFRVKNASELYTSMEKLITDQKLRQEMGAYAQKFVFDNSGALKQILAFIEKFMLES